MKLPEQLRSHLEVLRSVGGNRNTAHVVFGNGGRSPQFYSKELFELYLGFVIASGDLSGEDGANIFLLLQNVADLKESFDEEEAALIRDNLSGNEITGIPRERFERMLEKMISQPGRKVPPPDID